MKSKIKWIIFFLIIILCITAIKKKLPCFLHQDFYDYYEKASIQKVFAVIEDSYDFENLPIIQNNRIYIPVELIQNYIDKYIFWDNFQNKLIITTDDKVIKIHPDDLNFFVNNERMKLKSPIRKINLSAYIPADFLKSIYHLDINYLEKYKLVTVDFYNKSHTNGKIRSGTNMRYLANKKNPVVEKLLEGDAIRIFNTENKYTKIRNKNGLIGYVPTKKIIDKEISLPKKITISKANSKKISGKIKMVWDQITNLSANYYAVQKKIPDTVNVISPTWFYFDTEKLNGDVVNLADISYVENAHKNNCQVWALISDVNYKTNHEVISDSNKRERAINQLLEYISAYNLDGINIDFEAVSKDDAKYYLQFLRELSPLMKKQSAVLSVDMFVPHPWSNYYNRSEVGKTADYVCVMAYDEYNENSETSGPVASYQFVANGIKNTLKEVPQEKIILGIPFYVRIWRETNDGFTVKNFSMDRAFKTFSKHNVKFKWLDFEKCFFGQYKTTEIGEEATYKTWLEDEKSIEEKLRLAKKFNLAGISAWRKDFEKDGIWDLVDEYIK